MALETHDEFSSSQRSREAEGAHHRLGRRISKTRPLRAGNHLLEALRDLDLKFALCREVRAFFRLGRNRAGKTLWRVTEKQSSLAGLEIEISVPVHIVQPRSATVAKIERYGQLHLADSGIDAARDGSLGAREERFGMDERIVHGRPRTSGAGGKRSMSGTGIIVSANESI